MRPRPQPFPDFLNCDIDGMRGGKATESALLHGPEDLTQEILSGSDAHDFFQISLSTSRLEDGGFSRERVGAFTRARR
jgi:hypothetical protein